MTKKDDSSFSNEKGDSSFRTVILLFILVLMIISLIFYVITTLDREEEVEVEQQYIDVSKDDELEAKRAECVIYEDEIVRNNCVLKYTECKNDDCFYEKAITFRDRSFCDSVEDFTLKVDCLEKLFFNSVSEKAVNEDNVDVCTELEPKEESVRICRDNYYVLKASVTGDKSYCENIDSESLKDGCSE